MPANKSRAGFTLIELMIVVTIIGVIAAIAIPKLMSARISTNENAAIANLRAIAAAQQQLQASCALDTDADGGGEYGFLGELSGLAPVRLYGGPGNPPALGAAPDDLLSPPFLATAFGDLSVDAAGHGVAERQGYLYKIYLPGPLAAGALGGVAEDAAGGAQGGDLATWNSAYCEVFWTAYAWPANAEETGNRVFCINQEGDIVGYDNRDSAYDGLATPPAFDAAYALDTVAASMDQPYAYAVQGLTANDGNVWTRVGE